MNRAASLNLCALLCLWCVATVSVRAAQGGSALEHLLPADASGEEIYRQACAACHSFDGSGQAQSVVGFALAAFQRPRTARLHRLRDQHRGTAG
jgi:mono/diheme cytochrome c family protein